MRSMLLLGTLLIAAIPASASEPAFLVRSVPVPVNAVAVVNVASLLASPRAVKEGWSKLDHTEYLAGAIPVHPSVERILLAKEFHPGQPGRGGTIAVVPFKKELDLKKFATTFRGELTTIAGEQAVRMPNGSYAVGLGTKLLGTLTTDNRQDVARWIRSTKEPLGKSLQCQYINTALANSSTKPHIFVVVDTEDLFDDKHAALAVALSDLLKKRPKEAEVVEKFLKSMHGFKLAIDVTPEGIQVRMQFDGKGKPVVDPLLIRAFVTELFDRNGAHLEDLPAAKVEVNDGYVSFAFKLTDTELANLMALFLPPLPGIAESDAITITPGGAPDGKISGNYFRTVSKILEDLVAQNKRATQFQQTALWHETAASRIETLSIIGVDKALVDYAHGTAARLRAVADSLRGTPIKGAILESKAYFVTYTPPPITWTPGRGFHWNPWYPYGGSLETNIPQVQAEYLREAQKDADNRAKIWNSIDTRRSEVRNEMAKKYGSAFEDRK